MRMILFLLMSVALLGGCAGKEAGMPLPAANESQLPVTHQEPAQPPQPIPEGILFLRQVGSEENVMDRRQGLYLYKDGNFQEIEHCPYDVFPMGAYSCSWIEK